MDILAPEREARPGRHPGDRAVRLRRPRFEGVRRLEPGVYEISSAPEPRSALGRLGRKVRRTLIGNPIRSEHEGHERLSNAKALAVFGSDNISSSAYASEEIMRVLLLAGVAALSLTLPLTLAIVGLLVVVVVSYQQTIKAYPKGGGSYIVSSDNLGVIPGLVAGCSIQVGYVLTVAVSVSAGVAALTSAFPALYENRALIAVAAVAVMAWGNLRGLRESGTLFAAPAYVYLLAMLGLLAYGGFLYLTGQTPLYVPPSSDAALEAVEGVQALSLLLVLRAFASGAVGLTGTEAIADGVAAFKPPESRNARLVLVVMASCFAVVFTGISFLSGWLHIVPDPHEVETVISQLTRTLVGIGPYYYLVQFATALLLVLAANTAFADFPRLAYFMARDKFLPRHFAFRGERLAFSSGIIILAAVAAALILLFRGSVTGLLPLYGIGVFTAFTLSQAALVARWWRLRDPGWRLRLAINAAGATTTAIVAVVVGVTRFTQGAWVVLLLIPALVALLLGIRRHFDSITDHLTLDLNDAGEHPDQLKGGLHHYILIPVPDLNRATTRAIAYARSLTGGPTASAGGQGEDGTSVVVQAVHVTDDADDADQLQQKWERFAPGVSLVIIEAPYRTLTGPLLRYMDAVEHLHPTGTTVVTVLLPEFIPAHWWEHLLHTQTALMLKGALLFRPRTAVTSVPYHLYD
jgi:amino acid transporter